MHLARIREKNFKNHRVATKVWHAVAVNFLICMTGRQMGFLIFLKCTVLRCHRNNIYRDKFSKFLLLKEKWGGEETLSWTKKKIN